MRYWMKVNGEKVTFEFSLAGFRAAYQYLHDNHIGSRVLHVEVLDAE